MRIFVVRRNGETIEMDAVPEDTVGRIRSAIGNATTPQLSLTLRGKLLNDHLTLGECDVSEGMTLREQPRSIFWFLTQRAFHSAAQHGHRDALQVLLRCRPEGAFGDDARGDTPFHLAAWGNQYDTLELLLMHSPEGAKRKNASEDLLPLHYAAAQGHCEIVTLLLRYYSEGTVEGTFRGNSPLHLAVIYGREQMAALLLEHNPEVVMMKNHDERTPLDLAVRHRHPKLEALLKDCDCYQPYYA